MKNLKLSLTGIVCILILAGVFAFRSIHPRIAVEQMKQQTTTVKQWYIYIGTSPGLSFALDPNNYRTLSISENVSLLCNGYQTLCAIYAEPDPMNPGTPLITSTEVIYLKLVEYYTYGIWNPTYIKLKNF